METYYIYHIPGLKYGCTQKYPERPASQSNIYELIETHNDIMIASEREKELNLQASYFWDDTQYYFKMVSMGSKGALSQLNDGIHNLQKGYGNKKFRHSKEDQSNAAKIGNALPTHVNKQKSECPHCNKIGNYIAMRRWHFDNCIKKGRLRTNLPSVPKK
jgi:hypothetical protein